MKRTSFVHGCVLGLGVMVLGCGEESAPADPAAMGWQLTSPAFNEGAPSPPQFTCQGGEFASGNNPELDWAEGPAGTQSFALILKVPSVMARHEPSTREHNRGYHWVLWDIPASVRKLPTNMGDAEFPPEIPGARQWANRNQFGYFPPCPNADPAADPATHVTETYALTLYALGAPILAYPAPDPEVSNYSRTIHDVIEGAALAKTELTFTSNAASIAAPPAGGDILYPSPRP